MENARKSSSSAGSPYFKIDKRTEAAWNRKRGRELDASYRAIQERLGEDKNVYGWEVQKRQVQKLQERVAVLEGALARAERSLKESRSKLRLARQQNRYKFGVQCADVVLAHLSTKLPRTRKQVCERIVEAYGQIVTNDAIYKALAQLVRDGYAEHTSDGYLKK